MPSTAAQPGAVTSSGIGVGGNLLKALNVEVIVPHLPRATAFEVSGEFLRAGQGFGR